MNYSPHSNYLWDAWFIKKNNEYHVFYLQCPATKDPEERHHNFVSIGHAVCEDLIDWEELPAALEPGDKGSWDSLSLWTGSVVEKDGTYFLVYTGRNNNDFWIQRIGVALSKDLTKWVKYQGNPLLEADGKGYSMENRLNDLGSPPAFRDPYVFQDPESETYYMTSTGRDDKVRGPYNGCVGIAESKDLVRWNVLPPILSPSRYDEMETTQLVHYGGNYYLFFSTHTGGNGLHCYCSEKLFGEYKPVNGTGVVLDYGQRIYDVRLIENAGNEFTAIGWLNRGENGDLIGKLAYPFTIVIGGDTVYTRLSADLI